MQIPGVLRGEVPASYDPDNIGTKNYSRAPAAVLLGGAYEESDILEMREACKNDSKVPWLRPDKSKSAAPSSPGYAKAITERIKSRLAELSEGGQLNGDSLVFY
jgi:hypothetical protein